MNDTEENPILSWPECARLCKNPDPLALTKLSFDWGPTDHVLRRFLQTNALPNLEVLNVRLGSWDGGAMALLRGLAECGRPLKCMTITTGLDLAGTRIVRFTIQHDQSGHEVVHYESLKEAVSDFEVHYAAERLHLPTPLFRY